MNKDAKTNDILEQPNKAAGVDWNLLIFGLALVTVGLFLGLERFNLVDAANFWRWFPVGLVAAGLVRLSRGGNAKARDGGWWLLISGTYLLINFFEIWGFDWRNSWPLILIMVGGAHFVDPATSCDRTKSYWLMGLGTVFLVAQEDVLGLDYGDLWPLLIIAAGIGMTWRALATGGDSK